jgi:hypothetical protein
MPNIKGKPKDKIRQIGLDGGNGAREIVIQIASALGLKIHEDGKGVSAYGGNTIRIADHCTYMQTWVDNNTWNAPVRIDVVIEDNPTQPVTRVKNGFNFTVTEYVSSSNDIDLQKAKIIAYDIRNSINGNPYANNVRGTKRILKSTYPNNNKTNENRNMKQTIRLTESDLRNIIMEAINELEPQTYASYAKKRAEQGELDKAKEGQQKAISSFNAKYGSNKPDGRFGMAFNREYDPNGYDVEGRYETHGKHRDDGGNEQATTDIRWNLYNPQRGEVKTDRSITGRPNGGFTAGEWRDVDNDTKQEEWFKVAQQMANPNPEQDYVKGKGWSVDKLDESITRAIRKLLR